jgi:hypothetical protein
MIRYAHSPAASRSLAKPPRKARLAGLLHPCRAGIENLPDARALLRMGRAMVDLYCESFQRVPKRITLDINDTFDAVRGGQQLRLFNAHYDEYGFQPIVVFDGEGRFITAVLCSAKRPGGKEVRAFLRRLLRAIRANWPKTEILLRADSHLLQSGGSRLVSGQRPRLHPGRRADHHIAPAYRGPRGQHEGALRGRAEGRQGTPLQGVSTVPQAGAASSGSSPRVEAGAEGPDTRFIVTNLKVRNARVRYEDVYCRRGHVPHGRRPRRQVRC